MRRGTDIGAQSHASARSSQPLRAPPRRRILVESFLINHRLPSRVSIRRQEKFSDPCPSSRSCARVSAVDLSGNPSLADSNFLKGGPGRDELPDAASAQAVYLTSQ
jgi:hypothetical protein